MREVETLILGAGPVGAFLAWSRAERERVAVARKGPLAAEAGPVLELVPARTLSLLSSLMGVSTDLCPAEERLVAWSTAQPVAVPGPAFVVDRRELDAAMLIRLCERDGITLLPCAGVPVGAGPVFVGGVRANRVIDATGRAALTATARRSLRTPWLARSCWHARPGSMSSGIRVAATPRGYAVRITSRRHVTLTFVGPARQWHNIEDFGALLRRDAGYLLEHCPPVGKFARGANRRASVEFFHGPWLAAGDAAFARDALSSQGLSAGLSDALYAAAAESDDDALALRSRQAQQLCLHLSTLLDAARDCVYRDTPIWSAYRDDVAQLREEVAAQSSLTEDVMLIQGRIVRGEPRPPYLD